VLIEILNEVPVPIGAGRPGSGLEEEAEDLIA
jgi:hypothetical protein